MGERERERVPFSISFPCDLRAETISAWSTMKVRPVDSLWLVVLLFWLLLVVLVELNANANNRTNTIAFITSLSGFGFLPLIP